jgi:polysaccharide export outer membrane protein
LKSYIAKGARAFGFSSIAIAVVLVAGCGLPRPGPKKAEIHAGADGKQGNAFIVPVSPSVSRATSTVPGLGFSAGFRNAGVVGSDDIAAGDRLSVTVFENVKDDPLLGNTGQRVSALEEVQVDGQGYIFMPYAGRIKASGLTPDGLRQAITRELDTQTPDPQITVQRLAGDGSTVTVSGSVGAQGVYPIERPTRTLSAMIARAGGVQIEPETALIRVSRAGQSGQIWLQDLYANPRLDIALRPGDKVVVERDTRAFTALGATGTQSRVQFETQNLSAIEAIAGVGGLNSNTADPTGVFVFRNESAEIANDVLGRADLRGPQRMVYVLDLTEPTGIFEARDFLIRDGDTIYVTEAPFVQWQKTLSAITGATGAVNNIQSSGSGG